MTQSHIIKAIVAMKVANPNSTPQELVDECNRVIALYQSDIETLTEQIQKNTNDIATLNDTIAKMNDSIAELQAQNQTDTTQIADFYSRISMQNEIKNALIPPLNLAV